jgi:acyl-ACP thioesterase
MDMNGHVNNTAYITWILDALPDDLQNDFALAQYEVDYKAEVQAGVVLCRAP